jgi:hypothetical protein
MSSISKAGRGATLLRKPSARVLAGTVVAAVAVSSFAFTGTSAGAAPLPNAQSVGRFVDGSIGNTPIESIANVADASAVNPGSVTDQNPLNVDVLNTLDLPLTGALQLQQLLGINLGAANQVAVAKSDGYSYGASGAVANSGGVSVGGNNAAYPADATIDLTASGIAGNAAEAGNILGGVHVTIGAVSALASTPIGVDKGSSTAYQIAGLQIVAASPLLASILTPVTSALGGLLTSLVGAVGTVGLPTSCALTSGTIPDISLEDGAIVLSTSTGGLTIDLGKLLQVLGLNLNNLPPNTDLIDYLLNYLTSPSGLAAGLTDAINGLIDPLEAQFTKCIGAINKIPVLGTILTSLLSTLISGQTTLESTVTSLVGSLAAAAGPDPLAPIATILTKLVDIGVNVQPNGPKGDYTDALKATPAQNTPVVAGQTVVRALEVNLLGKAINLSLANAAAGPSAGTVVTPTTSAPPSTTVPTGVPAGQGPTGGTPTTPIVLLLLGLMTAGGGVMVRRLRIRRSH